MASPRAHRATGWAAGVMAAAIVARSGHAGPFYLWSLVACLAGAAGGTAPDWLELAWWSRRRRRWIAHRSLTHWGIGWIGLLAYGYLTLSTHPWAAAVLGFAGGGVMHLLADWPNPLGVPWIARRHSLGWWNSGRCDGLVVGLAWLAALATVAQGWA
ncbi:MAG: metal-dependent hydrolase [Paludibacterium sp.]|uniref:metal-dependent hydrolase n=1 Tax=Paludibacterium sp. TaxID=1917523 RepID=UPI0025D510F4|nr:metal-dependent hydrolase [Paludibacterium sp.]MBV8047075.1 metal-dependent hydrolase [Paludibacterium sp.]MBV8648614.1 metal-dependent hydrolase [Paludibacterium sp.]